MAHSLRPSFSDKDHFQGDIHASLELMEYGDYQCPHCGRAYPIIKQIQSQLGKELKFVFRNFPLSESHPQAFEAAVAAEAAGLQNAYWKMHDYLFEYQSRLPLSPFEAFAEALGLDSRRLIHDMQDPTLSAKVDADFDSGLHSGVNGTPTFFINGKRYDDSWDEDSLLAHLQQMLVKH
jgi:protein-disulfide isomerase